MKTQGALIWGLNEPWSVEEIEIGNPRHGEVTIQLEIAGSEVGERLAPRREYTHGIIRYTDADRA